MQNKTPIVVLTGLGIVAAAAVAGLTRDQWMSKPPEVVATAPAPEAAKTAETAPSPDAGQAAATAEAPKPAEQPAAADATQQTAAAQTETQPAASNAPEAPQVPAFDTVRVEKTGEAVIAGTAPAGSQVIVKLDGKAIGQTTANSDGAFVLVPEQPLPVGSGALTLEAKLQGGNDTITSPQSVAVIVPAADQPQEALVAVVSPDQPTRVLQKPEVRQAAEKPAKLVSIDAVDYDPAGNIVFSGQGEPGNTARIYIDNSFLGDAPVGADGRWSYAGTAQVAPGVHTLRVDGLDGAGKVLNRVEVPFVREQQNKVAEATAPASTEPAAGDSASAQQPAAAAPAKPKEGRVVIQPGNNLWRIARVLYGDGARFTELYEANKDQIRDPNRIYPGQVFRTPDVAPTSETIDPKRRDPLKPEENAASGQ